MDIQLYTLFLKIFHLGIRLFSLWNAKAKAWRQGRKFFPHIDFTEEKAGVVWMHCASLGEFEQGRPLIEAIKFRYPACKIAVSFFSPSGYEIVKNFRGADVIFYLPEDSVSNAQKIISNLNPSLVLWVKYEYWFYYLDELKKNNVPTLLIAGVYRSNMPFFRWYGGLWKKMLGAFTHFFVQNQPSKKMLEKVIPAARITNSGDTRFDRVTAIAENFREVEGIAEFIGTNAVVVAGSTWEDDEAEWVHYVRIHPEITFIIAPHEVDRENLSDVKKQFPNSLFYSQWINGLQQPLTHRPHCLIIDNIGMLSRLYKYATICYVGGGFRSKGLHNTLEAAVYGKPVIFGPEYGKNFEAFEMIRQGGAISINNALELEQVLNRLLTDAEYLNKTSEAAKKYVYGSAGATKKIMQFIKQNAFLPVDQTASRKGQHPSSQS